MAKEGERGEGDDGGQGEEEEKGKRTGRLVGSPASLRDFHEDGPTRSCFTASSALGTDLRRE